MKENFTRKPSPEYQFFLYDPEGEGFLFFRTEEERDAAAGACIQGYLGDDGWLESVEDIFTGCVTGHAVPVGVEFLPLRSEFETDEGYQAAQDELAFYEESGCDYRCDYRLADINDPGESTKRPDALKDEIRDVFLSHGIKIKDGCDDLKPYVYEAARALLTRFNNRSLLEEGEK